MKAYRQHKHWIRIHNPFPRLKSYLPDLMYLPRRCNRNEVVRCNHILPDSLPRNHDSPSLSVATCTRKHDPAQPAAFMVCGNQRDITKPLYGVVGIKNLLV